MNTPMNPTGKVFEAEELAAIADLVVEHDAFAVCDEVYEHLVFDGLRHTPLMCYPGMRDRTVRIGSAGKTFSLTGWKVGYVTAPPHLLQPIARAHQFLTFTTPPNLQRAAAYGLNKEDAYFSELARDMQRKRDLLRAGLAEIGFRVASCQGTYFVGADVAPLGVSWPDYECCRRMTIEAKVAAVPYSAFYQAGRGPTSWVRFAFCKQESVLREALERLRRYFTG
jgi:aspartate/methionine/tyrosine aminotransferase